MTRDLYPKLALAILLGAFAPGCGTIRCISEDRDRPVESRGSIVYGGARRTWEMQDDLAGSGGNMISAGINECAASCLTPFYLVDSLLSFAADTAALPYTIPRSAGTRREQARIRGERVDALGGDAVPAHRTPDAVIPFDPAEPYEGTWQISFTPVRDATGTAWRANAICIGALDLRQDAGNVTGVVNSGSGGSVTGAAERLAFRGVFRLTEFRHPCESAVLNLAPDGMSADGTAVFQRVTSGEHIYSIRMLRRADRTPY